MHFFEDLWWRWRQANRGHTNVTLKTRSSCPCRCVQARENMLRVSLAPYFCLWRPKSSCACWKSSSYVLLMVLSLESLSEFSFLLSLPPIPFPFQHSRNLSTLLEMRSCKIRKISQGPFWMITSIVLRILHRSIPKTTAWWEALSATSARFQEPQEELIAKLWVWSC